MTNRFIRKGLGVFIFFADKVNKKKRIFLPQKQIIILFARVDHLKQKHKRVDLGQLFS